MLSLSPSSSFEFPFFYSPFHQLSLLPKRMSEFDRLLIPSEASGLLYFNTLSFSPPFSDVELRFSAVSKFEE